MYVCMRVCDMRVCMCLSHSNELYLGSRHITRSPLFLIQFAFNICLQTFITDISAIIFVFKFFSLLINVHFLGSLICTIVCAISIGLHHSNTFYADITIYIYYAYDNDNVQAVVSHSVMKPRTFT